MKPICCFSAAGNPISSVISNMTGTVNRLLKDRPFRYLDTIVMPELGAIGAVTYSVQMIFEADSQEDIDKLQMDQKAQTATGILKPV